MQQLNVKIIHSVPCKDIIGRIGRKHSVDKLILNFCIPVAVWSSVVFASAYAPNRQTILVNSIAFV